MAKQYELECGHCGYLFTIEGDTRTRSVKCPVCGGVLTVAIAIPVVPETPPAPPPPTPVFAPLPPPTFSRKRDLESLPPHRRAEYLSEPWWDTYRALKQATLATDIARYCSVLYLCFALFMIMLLPPAEQREIWKCHACVAILFILPIAIHALQQLSCALALPMQVSQFAIASLVVLGLASLPLVWFVSTQQVFAMAVCGVLLLMSFGFWLWFLRRLGQNLGDDNLVHYMEVLTWQFAARFVLALALGIGGFLAMREGVALASWVCQSTVGVIVLLILWEYSRLLRGVAMAIARRGPLDPHR